MIFSDLLNKQPQSSEQLNRITTRETSGENVLRAMFTFLEMNSISQAFSHYARIRSHLGSRYLLLCDPVAFVCVRRCSGLLEQKQALIYLYKQLLNVLLNNRSCLGVFNILEISWIALKFHLFPGIRSCFLLKRVSFIVPRTEQ